MAGHLANKCLRIVKRLFWHRTVSWGGRNHSLDSSLKTRLEANAKRNLVLLLHLSEGLSRWPCLSLGFSSQGALNTQLVSSRPPRSGWNDFYSCVRAANATHSHLHHTHLSEDSDTQKHQPLIVGLSIVYVLCKSENDAIRVTWPNFRAHKILGHRNSIKQQQQQQHNNNMTLVQLPSS